MQVIVVQLLNSLLYAAILFLIAGGLSLIYGVMRIVNLAHGTLFAVGAYVMAWMVGQVAATTSPFLLLGLLPIAALAVSITGGVIESLFLRPLLRRAEEYQ